MPIIEQVRAREILDSRGNPTVEVEVALIDGTFARRGAVGRLDREHEAVELRDGGDRYGGKGVQKAVQAVLDEIGPAVIGLNADDQRLVDQALVDLDGTPTSPGWAATRSWVSRSLLPRRRRIRRSCRCSVMSGAKRAHSAGTDDEHPQRRRTRRYRCRHSRVHGGANWRAQLRRGVALGR